jgi:hypothetical protein
MEPRFPLTRAQRRALERWSVDPRNELRATKAKVLLDAASGISDADLAVLYSLDVRTVTRWIELFVKLGLASLTGTTRGVSAKASDKMEEEGA